MDHYVFDGAELTVEDIIGITSAKLTLSEKVWQRIADNRAALENLIEQSGERYYGINTGFGSLYSVTVSPDGLQQLQTNLLRSHACGVGPAVPQAIVRLTLLMKIISLAQGQSGVRKEVIRFLLDLYNLHITPVVPMLGSLGASGDLAPLAHLCLPMIGEGEVVYKREQMPAAKALMLAGLDAIDLEAKEGLALINGTQYSLAWLVYSINSALRLSEVCEMTAAMSIDAFDAHPSFLDAGIHAVRKQVGQMQSAEAISKWLDGSEVIKKTKEHLQDPYSFRCAPQVHGASRDVITYAKTIADREINAVTDNPLVLGDGDDVRIVSGGNFHAQPLALTSDFLALAIAEYGSISERRSYLLLGGKRGLPPTLAQNPGLESGMMICQYTAAAIVNRNKILSHPASTDSIISSAGQEDHVSMAANAGIKLYEIINNVWKLLAIEWMISTQALEYRRPLKTSPQLEQKHMAYRLQVLPLSGDRSHSSDIDMTENFLRQISFSRT
ncbi:MAG: histidine ammonia-lyase [Saprospiraceae bacterium]|nr:histidine ammonia-lyase [Candidatus Opimibacter skivensis]MBP6679668.1 histidine ammonia-lyase [Saprospiraceae bacterium]MBP8086474.1 histidine ammonia-lyase [Saprospiraceae bacterium]